MLEASNYDAVDTVPPFMGAILYKYCAFIFTPIITKVFTKHVNLVNLVFQKYQDLGWIEEENFLRNERIISFKAFNYNIFVFYKASNMSTNKWHALDLVYDGIREGGYDIFTCWFIWKQSKTL